LVQNAQHIGLIDTVFEALGNNKSFSETCDFRRLHAIRHNQQAKEKNARQIHTTCQPTCTTKKDKVMTILALINEQQLQDSIEGYYSSFISCKLTIHCTPSGSIIFIIFDNIFGGIIFMNNTATSTDISQCAKHMFLMIDI
jgi:hypothetical protein